MKCVPALALLLAGCDAASSDYPTVVEARSTSAEWALVNRLAVERRLTATYTKAMREEARRQLDTAQSALSEPTSAAQLQALLALPPDAPPAKLRAHAEALKTIEDRLAVS
jgi:hypothetical protein